MMHGQIWLLRFRSGLCLAASVVTLTGCATREVCLPQGYLPIAAGRPDTQTSALLITSPSELTTVSKIEPTNGPPPIKAPFDLPRGLPGATTPPITPPRFTKDTSQAERVRTVEGLYPKLKPLSAPSHRSRSPL